MLSGFIYLIFSLMKYATDIEWSRYIMFLISITLLATAISLYMLIYVSFVNIKKKIIKIFFKKRAHFSTINIIIKSSLR